MPPGEVRVGSVVFSVSVALKLQFAGPIAVAGYAQVPCVTHVYAKLQAVRPHDFRPIVHDLILVFSLEQWAVARIHAQPGAEVRQPIAIVATSIVR